MSPGGEDLEPFLACVNVQIFDFKVSKRFESGVETVTATFFSNRTIKALQPESVTRTFEVTLLPAENITSQWVTDTAEKSDYIKKSWDYPWIAAFHFAYFGLIEAPALFALTRVGKCFARCCRRKERPHQGFAVEEKVTLLSAGNITSQWVTDTAEKGDYIKKSLDYATITALGKVTTYIRARFMSPGGEDLEPTLESVNFQVSDFKVSKMFDSGVETVTARFFSDRTIKALQPESVTRTFVEP